MPQGLDFILMILVFGGIMYFLMIRPQQKRMKEHQATIAALQPGSRVLLTSGVFATIRHLGERQAIVELAPGVEITIVKGNIARPVTADEEEFEFADDDAELGGDDVVLAEPVVTDPVASDPVDAAAPGMFDPRPIDADALKHDKN